MKKFLSAILSFAMIFALSIPAFAADITVAPTETVTNEYQSMLELQKISNATLAAEGYTPSEIETIRNTDQIFDDHIALLNTLSDNSLQTAGYTVDQIRGIRNYDPDSATVNEKVALSAECVTTSTIDNYTGTTGRVTSEFEWVGVPAFKMTDILITAWNNWQITGKSANIKYSHINGTEPSYWQSPTYQKPESGMTSYGSGYSYNAALQDNYFYASEGYSIFVLSRQSSSHLETISRVSHQQGIATLNYSISSGFDIGISIGRKLLGDRHDETPA